MNLLQWHGPAVKKLLGWKQGDEEEKWSEKAVDALVKKLKKRKKGDGEGTVEDLEWALANPTSTSRCVTIPRSLDGRLQVSHKKGLPHVIYCRVWRWPDLHSHQELRAIPECMYPFEGNRGNICINPYHYVRIENPRHLGASSQYSPRHPAVDMPGTSSTYHTPSPPYQIAYSSDGSPTGYMTHSPTLSDDDECQRMVSPITAISKLKMPPPAFWATINYYELNTRVGEQFKVYLKEITVDGFTDPSNDGRICLGLLTNVNRNNTIENTRRHIGRGIKLIYYDSLNLDVTNHSNSPVFVQSRNCNWKMGVSPQTVLRVPPGVTTTIFDHQIFVSMLNNARMAGYNQLYELEKMCFIRVSFVKGWGDDYPRQDVTSTPCWIELQMHTPLAWIDQCLHNAGNPNGDITSVS